MVRTNSVEFTYKTTDYRFNFIDLSGETATQAFSGELNDPEIKNEVISTCKEADHLFLVISLEDYANEKSNQLADLLTFISQVMQRTDLKTLFEHGLTIYVSHPEKLSEDAREEFFNKIKERFSKSNPSLSDDVYCLCSSVVEAEDDQLQFYSKDVPFTPHRMFSEIFADLSLVSKDDPMEKAISTAKKNTFTLKGLIILLILCGVGYGGYQGIQKYQEEQAEKNWARLKEEFQKYTEENLNEENVIELLTKVELWLTAAKEEHALRLRRDGLDTRAEDLIQQGDEIANKESEHEELKAKVDEIIQTHKTNYSRVYDELLIEAEKALANPTEWTPKASKSWKEIQHFVQALQNGVFIKIEKPFFVTDYGWQFMLELHIFDRSNTIPYGEENMPPSSIQGIQFERIAKQKKGKKSNLYLWPTSEISSVRYIPTKHRIDIRFLEQKFGTKDCAEKGVVTIEQQGVHGLSSLDEELELNVSEKKNWFQANLTKYSLYEDKEGSTKLVIPEELLDAYRGISH